MCTIFTQTTAVIFIKVGTKVTWDMGKVLKTICFSILFQNGGKSKMAAKIKIILKYACWVPNELSQQDLKLGGIHFLVTQKTKWRRAIQNGRQN